MGRDVWTDRAVPPQPTHNEIPVTAKVSRTIRLIDSFTQNFSKKAFFFEFIFCMAVHHHD